MKRAVERPAGPQEKPRDCLTTFCSCVMSVVSSLALADRRRRGCSNLATVTSAHQSHGKGDWVKECRVEKVGERQGDGVIDHAAMAVSAQRCARESKSLARAHPEMSKVQLSASA